MVYTHLPSNVLLLLVPFTPNLPLAGGVTYHVQSPPAVDLSSNAQPGGLDYTFTTTNGTPPAIVQLVAAGNGTVIENTATSVAATVGAFDVAYVDFFLNDVFAATDQAPFVLNFQAVAALRSAARFMCTRSSVPSVIAQVANGSDCESNQR